MKTHTTTRSIHGVTVLGLLMSLIAVVFVPCAAADRRASLATPAIGDAVIVLNANAAYAAATAIPPSHGKRQSIAVGQAAAAAFLATRADDSAVGPFPNLASPQETIPRVYQCTPGTPYVVFERWQHVIPFVLKNSSQLRPRLPHAVANKQYTSDFNEVKRIGGDDVTTPSL